MSYEDQIKEIKIINKSGLDDGEKITRKKDILKDMENENKRDSKKENDKDIVKDNGNIQPPKEEKKINNINERCQIKFSI